MKINETSLNKPAASVKKRKEVSGAGNFSSFLTGETESVSELHETSDTHAVAPTGLDSVLSLQEVPEDELKKKKAVAYGNTALETLEQLRHALLMGNLPEHVLRNLNTIVEQHKALAAPDPRLTAIINDIELRAAVELAKLEMARTSPTDGTFA